MAQKIVVVAFAVNQDCVLQSPRVVNLLIDEVVGPVVPEDYVVTDD
jgi:hypothetical protein